MTDTQEIINNEAKEQLDLDVEETQKLELIKSQSDTSNAEAEIQKTVIDEDMTFEKLVRLVN